MKRKIIFAVLTVFMAATAYPQSKLHVEDVVIQPNEQSEIVVKFDFEQENMYTAYSFDLILPDGVSLTKNARGKIIYTLGDCHEDTHSLTINYVEAEKLYAIACISLESDPIYGKSGILMKLPVEMPTPPSVQQKLKAELKNIKFIPLDGSSATQAENVVFNITVGTPGSGPEVKAYTAFKDNVLTFYYDNEYETREGLVYDIINADDDPKWSEIRESVVKVVFDSTFSNYMPTSTNRWFSHFINLEEIVNIANLHTGNVTDMKAMFYLCGKLQTIDVGHFDTKNVVDMSYLFSDCTNLKQLNISNFNTNEVKTMEWMFLGCENLENLDLSNFKTDKVTSMQAMFYECKKMSSIDTRHFNTSNVTDMNWMFYGCESLTQLELNNFDTSNVTKMRTMFYRCKNLTSLDLSHFNTSKVETMRSMFGKCENLTSLNISSFDTRNVKSMKLMFLNCEKLKSIDVSSFNTKNVTDMDSMFYHCNSLKDLNVSNFDIETTTHTRHMLHCHHLETLAISSSMDNLEGSACSEVGSPEKPCRIVSPNGFDFGVDTSRNYFVWKSGYFTPSDDIKTITFGEKIEQPFYNLQGVRTTSPKRGIYIQNGKKVVVK